MIIVFAGFSGTGKSYLAKKLKDILNCPYLNSDIVRKQIARVNPVNHFYEKYGKGLYSPKMTELTYDFLLKKANDLSKKEKFVIIDATFTSIEMQKKLIQSNLDYKFFWCYAPDEVVKERLERRKNERENVSDATYEIYLKQKENFKGLTIPEERLYKICTAEENALEKIMEILEVKQ